MKKHIKKHPVVTDRDRWFSSPEGERVTNGTAYGQYLRNRLEIAYLAGWFAAERRAKRKP